MTAELDLQQTGERVKEILEELSGGGDRRTMLLAEELVRSLTSLYGAGLEHILQAIEARAPQPEAVLEALAEDELVASLLVLHGIHPVDTLTRVERGLERVRPYLASHGGDVEVLELQDDGVLRLRLKGSCDGCGASAQTIKHAVEAAVLEIAPEVVSLDVEGLPPPRFDADDLIPLETVARKESIAAWSVLTPPSLAAGEVVSLQVENAALLLCRIGDSLYAYRSACVVCGQTLQQERLDQEECVSCGRCGASFNLRLAGRRPGVAGRGLEPVPLLETESGIRLALEATA
jgi:Fe-S cluster biogenesis protein NfuA/nitrite reductase/ring-hydroxylating ferredoxin subunit